MGNGWRDIAGHHGWATTLLLTHCQGLDEATLNATAPGTYGSTIQHFRHLVDADDARYPQVSEKELEEAGPEVIMLSSEPYPLNEKHVREIKDICPEADVRLVVGELFSWYDSKLLTDPEYFNGTPHVRPATCAA